MNQCRNVMNILVGISLTGIMVACATNTNTAGMQAPDAGAGSAQVAAAAPAVQVAAVPNMKAASGAEISAAPAAKTDAVREPAAVVESRPTRTVAELAAQLHKDRRALYISSEGSYQFYIGGVLKAKYFPDDQKLVLLDMSTDQSQPCNYNIDGRLQTKAKGKNTADVTKSCADLVEKLNNSLPN
ncbi:MAG: hypothetical protein HY272_04890 [Gammaproteobacteria bacterium]|nr:hypothetical protein [Gammaproteobacteria bacterium]